MIPFMQNEWPIFNWHYFAGFFFFNSSLFELLREVLKAARDESGFFQKLRVPKKICSSEIGPLSQATFQTKMAEGAKAFWPQ